MATIRDVARLAGVSTSTVSLALNGTGPVSRETYQKVQSAARAAGYAPNSLAQSLSIGRTRLVGMVVADVSNPFFGRLLKQIERLALERNHLVILSDTGGDPDRERAILDHLSGQRVAGVILTPHGTAPDYVDHLRGLTMPLVLIDHKVEGVHADFVGSDNFLAAAMVTEHVIRFGHTRIAHIAGITGLYTSERRKDGFRA